MHKHSALSPAATPQPLQRFIADAHANAPCADVQQGDSGFVQLLDGYRSSGGLARAQEVAALCARCGGPDMATLALWILQREVICVEWHTGLWLPLFQFQRLDMQRCTVVAHLLTELNSVYSPWEVAHWFVQPQPCLRGQTPVQRLPLDPLSVLNFAHAR